MKKAHSLFRSFAHFRKLQSYEEFLNKNPKNFDLQKPLVIPKLERLDEKSLIERHAEMNQREFYTESSDFDVEAFSLKEYMWSCIFMTRPTIFRVIWCFLIYSTLSFSVKAVYMGYKSLRIKWCANRYFCMLEPAFRDIQLLKYDQRLYFKTLHSYD